MKKQLKDTQILLEILILTAAVAIIAAAVYFFSGTKPYFCQQYFGSWYRTFQLCTVASFRHHHDSERSTSDHRLFYLRKRIWCKNRLHQYHASCFSWTF